MHDNSSHDQPQPDVSFGEAYAEEVKEAEARHAAESQGADNDGGFVPHIPLLPPPPKLHKDALYGPLATVVEKYLPHTEAHEAALLINLLTGFGNIAGRHSFTVAGNSNHYPNLFSILIGNTSRGRKGTSWACVKDLLGCLDASWPRWKDGLVSGEGLIFNVRDAEPKTTTSTGKQQKKQWDEGVSDKRLFVVEEEFASVIKAGNRESSTLSPVLRNAWDGHDQLSTLAKNNPTKSTNPHISIVGHITRHEALALLSKNDSHNGFANRFLWVFTERSKLLPNGSRMNLEELTPTIHVLHRNLKRAWERKELVRNGEANDLWASVYPQLSAGHPGLFGAVTSRAEAQVVRLSLVYALSAGESIIKVEHLKAALALWAYCEATARWVFGTGFETRLAPRIQELLREHPEGVSRTQINNMFKGKQTAAEITAALKELERLGIAKCEITKTVGRSAEAWKLIIIS